MEILRVNSEGSKYDVVVGRGAWRALRRFPKAHYSSIFLLTERRLWLRWGKLFLREAGLRGVRLIFVPEGEASKALVMVEHLAARMLELGADRQSLVIAFGGGVVGDLGGFVASTYMRGLHCVQVPTTVVAQVDSAIGGKTGVNVVAMKNLVGTIHPPRLVLADPFALSSLTDRVFRSGFYEVVKHAILSGPAFFQRLESTLDSLDPEDAEGLSPILAEAAKVKVDVVSRDEREAGLRRVLNLGHTFGHALEEATHYRRFLHGEAVGWGLLGVFCLAERLGFLHAEAANRMARLVERVGDRPPIRDVESSRILRLLPRDKKTVGGRIHWVIPERIGKVRIVADVPPSIVAAAYRSLQQTRWR